MIGKPGRRIAESEAWAHVAGYSCYNDGSVRDWQRHTSQFTPGKNFVATGAFGPWLVPAGEIPAGERLTLTTRLNGQVMQQATTEMMIFPIPRLDRLLLDVPPARDRRRDRDRHAGRRGRAALAARLHEAGGRGRGGGEPDRRAEEHDRRWVEQACAADESARGYAEVSG